MAFTPEANRAYIGRLNLLREAPISIQAHAIGDAWFTFAAFSTLTPDSLARKSLRGAWSNLASGIAIQSPENRVASLREFAHGLRVIDEESGDFKFVRKIRNRVVEIIGSDLMPVDSIINLDNEKRFYNRPLTVGARVLVAAYCDLGSLNRADQAELGTRITMVNDDQFGTRTSHVISAISGTITDKSRVAITV